MKINLNDLQGAYNGPIQPVEHVPVLKESPPAQKPLPPQPPEEPRPELDRESLQAIEKLEGIIAKGQWAFIQSRLLWVMAIYLVITAALKWVLLNPYWYFFLLGVPVYLLFLIIVASYAWTKLPAQIARIRSGKPFRLPRDAHEAQFILGFGAVAVFACAFIELENPSVPRQWTAMLLISGSVFAIWGAIKFTVSVWKTPKEKLIAGARALSVAWWFVIALAIATGWTSGVFMDQLATRYVSRRYSAQLELKKLEAEVEKAKQKANDMLKKLEAQQQGD